MAYVSLTLSCIIQGIGEQIDGHIYDNMNETNENAGADSEGIFSKT